MDALADIAFQKMSASRAKREEWVAVLDVCFLPRARSLAIQRITCFLKGVDKILMGRKYKVKTWLLGGLCDMVTRSASFSDEEEDQLGFKTITKLYRLREKRFKEELRYPYTKEIRTMFEDEMKEMSNDDDAEAGKHRTISPSLSDSSDDNCFTTTPLAPRRRQLTRRAR